MFLTPNDYNYLIKQVELSRAINADHSLRMSAELSAQSEIESYLRARYDVLAIFSATGTERHPMIMKVMIDLVIYELFSRITPDQMPEIRLQRWEAALEWLKAVRDGKISVDLPPNPTDTEAENKPKNFFTKSDERKIFDF